MFPPLDPMTTKSTSTTPLPQKSERCTPSFLTSGKPLKISLMKTLPLERSVCPTPHKPLPSSSSRRKMEDSIPVTLDSGRGKHRLLRRRCLTRFSRRASSRGKGQGFLEGLLQRTEVLGASAASLSNERLRKTFQG